MLDAYFKNKKRKNYSLDWHPKNSYFLVFVFRSFARKSQLATGLRFTLCPAVHYLLPAAVYHLVPENLKVAKTILRIVIVFLLTISRFWYCLIGCSDFIHDV